MTPEHLPAFTDALYTVITLAVIVGFIVIFQAMYTAVLERTREIGILKSLGASQGYIVGLVLRETALLAVVGIALGMGITFVIRGFMDVKFPTLPFIVSPHWIVSAVLIALGWVAGRRQLSRVEGGAQRSHRGARVRIVVGGKVKNPTQAQKPGLNEAQSTLYRSFDLAGL